MPLFLRKLAGKLGLSFEEALADLLQVAPPPKDKRPEPEPRREPPKDPPRRKRQPEQDKVQGGR